MVRFAPRPWFSGAAFRGRSATYSELQALPCKKGLLELWVRGSCIRLFKVTTMTTRQKEGRGGSSPACIRRCFEGHCSDLDAENFCRGLTDVELARRWIQSRRSFMVDTYLPIQSVSPGIRVSGRKIYHPQCRLKHEWVQFTATFSDCLAVGLGGQWSNNDSFLIGVTPAECNFDPAAHPADLGFFFAPRSVSMLGLDGTNFSWPSELQAAWERQMTEEGFDCEMNDFSRHGEGCCLATFQGAAWCIKRSKLNELEIYYLHDDEWAAGCMSFMPFSLHPDVLTTSY